MKLKTGVVIFYATMPKISNNLPLPSPWIRQAKEIMNRLGPKNVN